jgi:hypothetical protein
LAWAAVPGVSPKTAAMHARAPQQCMGLSGFSRHPPCWGPPPYPHACGAGTAATGRPRGHRSRTGDGYAWGGDATGARAPQHPAGRGHRRPSPQEPNPLSNRPIDECGTGAGEGSKREGKKERGFGWASVVYSRIQSQKLQVLKCTSSLPMDRPYMRRLMDGVHPISVAF